MAFFATLGSGVYQMGEAQARSWIVAGTIEGAEIPNYFAS